MAFYSVWCTAGDPFSAALSPRSQNSANLRSPRGDSETCVCLFASLSDTRAAAAAAKKSSYAAGTIHPKSAGRRCLSERMPYADCPQRTSFCTIKHGGASGQHLARHKSRRRKAYTISTSLYTFNWSRTTIQIIFSEPCKTIQTLNRHCTAKLRLFSSFFKGNWLYVANADSIRKWKPASQ